MTFNPNNPIIQLCIQGIDREEKGVPEEARRLFLQAWHEATNDFEKFMAAHFVARHQGNVASPAATKSQATTRTREGIASRPFRPRRSQRTAAPSITGRKPICGSAIS
jgi:hypothetical protein